MCIGNILVNGPCFWIACVFDICAAIHTKHDWQMKSAIVAGDAHKSYCEKHFFRRFRNQEIKLINF